ncbi:hypothetical protein CBR_g38653 [Chara braunii]|uniref:Uncharacterized protein n=1 Tax=Chara braunii TaxID=69332 RepID=A0A388K0N0_CHABU|nr:hypothetical protein CBR_g38653 [Chara braunii]|eukprot:GBG63587.1 hypothetical protein CBR_g38653 [Chara braunii]
MKTCSINSSSGVLAASMTLWRRTGRASSRLAEEVLAGGGSASTGTPRSQGGRPRSNALRWCDDKDGFPDNGPMFERLTVRDHMAMWDAPARPDVVFLEPVKLLQILGMFEKTCPRHGKEVEVTIEKISYPCHICKLQFMCGKGCTWHWNSAKVVKGGVRDSRVETQLFHSTVAAGMTHTQLNNLLMGLGMKKKCMWHKAKTFVKRLREAVRATKTFKPSVVGACKHVREVRCFTKKEPEVWLETKGVRVPGAATKKKDELVEIVWGVLFPNEAGKPLEDDVVEIDALEGLHCNAAEEAKEWLYGACRMRERARDDDGDVLASHVQHLADHWARDHSMCGKELSNLCKAAGGSEREPLYKVGGRVHAAVSRLLRISSFTANRVMILVRTRTPTRHGNIRLRVVPGYTD